MNRACFILPVAITLLLVTTGAVFAETIYVNDRLIVGIRETPDTATPSIGTLKSDDAVELLAEGEVFFHVRTGDGKEGYVKKQYLTSSRPKTLIIADLEKKLAREKKALADMQKAMSSSESEVQKIQLEQKDSLEQLKQQLLEKDKQLAENARQADKLRRDLEAAQNKFKTLEENSGDVITIVNDRESLKKENASLTDDLNALRDENAYLLRTGVIKWFLAGAGVLFFGWMIGKSSRRKRRY